MALVTGWMPPGVVAGGIGPLTRCPLKPNRVRLAGAAHPHLTGERAVMNQIVKRGVAEAAVETAVVAAVVVSPSAAAGAAALVVALAPVATVAVIGGGIIGAVVAVVSKLEE